MISWKRIGAAAVVLIAFGAARGVTADDTDSEPDTDTGADADSDADADGDSDTDADADTDTDADGDYCANSSDPCCLDDGNDEEVLALSGCNGYVDLVPEPGETGGECTYDPEDTLSYGNCDDQTMDMCWPYPYWYAGIDAEGGECGLCLRRCLVFAGCPSGDSPDFHYDFCTSDCPAGYRCWVYRYKGAQRGLCMMDCVGDEECGSGICDPLWNICAPRPATCQEDTDTDSDSQTWDTESEQPDAGDEAKTDPGGCVCRSSGIKPAPRRLLGSLADLL